MPDPASSPAIAPEAVARDLPCVNCGYSLAGLRADGKCPECAWPVARSLKGNLLRFCPPDYLRRLHAGAAIVLISFVAGLVVLFVGLAVSAVMAGFLRTSPAYLLRILGLVPEIGALIGWLMLSSPEPSFRGRDEGASARRVVRLCLLVGIACSMFVTAAVFGGAPPSVGRTMMHIPDNAAAALATIAEWVNLLASTVRFFASLVYIRALGRRIPDEPLRTRAKTLMWLGPAFVILGVVGMLVAGIATLGAARRAPGSPIIALVLSIIPAGVLGIIWLVSYGVLLERLRRDLRRALRESESRVAAEPQPRVTP